MASKVNDRTLSWSFLPYGCLCLYKHPQHLVLVASGLADTAVFALHARDDPQVSSVSAEPETSGSLFPTGCSDRGLRGNAELSVQEESPLCIYSTGKALVLAQN